MTVLQVVDVSFGYGATTLFQNISFSLSAGERMALVAPNGAGKSTLLRLIAREIQPDNGAIITPTGLRIGYFRQSHEAHLTGTVMRVMLSHYASILELRQQLEAAQHAAETGTEEALAHLARLTDRYHLEGGDDIERHVEMIATPLGFQKSDLDRTIESLSGGERSRLNLGALLAFRPDLLLLDEPTNHLDIETISWLEQYLRAQQGAILCVSHDRAFLDALCPKTMELGRRSFRIYPLRYSDYANARLEDLERERAGKERQDAFIEKTEDFIRRNIAGQKTKQAQSRRKMLEKMDVMDCPEDVWRAAEKIQLAFAPAPRTGDIVLEGTQLNAERGGRTLFSNLDLLVRRGDRIGLIGPNGAGKSTLLKRLAGFNMPGDGGTLRRGTNLCEGYFDQHLGALNLEHTAVEEIRSIRGDWNDETARSYLGKFRFSGDDTLRRISGYSGGERSRLALAKLLLEPKNLLFFDEPTNHLDIPACEILEEALANFEGTAIVVSHDRTFLNHVTTRILHLCEGTHDHFSGGYKEYIERKPNLLNKPISPTAVKINKGKEAFEADKAAQRAIDKKRKRSNELEKFIALKEEEALTLRNEISNTSSENWQTLATLVEKEKSTAHDIEQMMHEWMQLLEELEKM